MNSPVLKWLAFYGICSFSLIFSAAAAPILIDFGRSDNQTETGNFNNVHGPSGVTLETPLVDLIDSEGTATGISIATDFGSGGSWAGTQADYAGDYPDVIADQPVSALQDSMFIREPASTTLTLAGLDASAAYDILIYGARSNNGGPNTEWTATDGNGETLLTLDVFDNSDGVVLFSGLVPDENDEITILYTTTADGNRPRGALNFMRISEADTAPFNITSIVFDRNEGNPMNTVEWSSVPDRFYGLFYSTDLKTWAEVDDGIESEGDSTSYSHVLLPLFNELVDVPRLYYRIEYRVPVVVVDPP